MTPEDDTARPWDDPIVSELRKAREAILAAADCDLGKLGQRLRQERVASGRTFVAQAPRRANHRDGEAV